MFGRGIVIVVTNLVVVRMVMLVMTVMSTKRIQKGSEVLTCVVHHNGKSSYRR